MKVNLLLVVLLGLLALSYGFKLERNERGRGKGQGRGEGRPDDNDDDRDDDDMDDDDMDGNREDLPRLVVGVIARRIRMQLDNCDMSEFSGVTSFRDVVENFGKLLLKDCGRGGSTGGPSPPPPTGGPTDGPTEGPTGGPTSPLPARELDEKVVRELMNFLEEKRAQLP
uniref:Uncharacterized protein LOC111138467 n=1 Tax=Crassostrea virginica TaxID=6565 RepID=A0A8B8F1U7_CRAVI|nr:uncharacterized protein LOC111138467 [Crassostrea virginica]